MLPEHPETIILKNKYYPNGLREIDIYNHYQYYKQSIIEQANRNDIMIFIKTDGIFVKRKGKTTRFIRINNSNYNEIITGRTLSIHATMKSIEDFGIVDIDTDNFDKAREATKDSYDILKRIPIFGDLQIRFTGKTSFHIVCKLYKKSNIDSIRLLFQKIFNNSSISDKYTISKSRSGNTPNIDLFRNSHRAGYIILNSLSSIGLKCTEVKYNELLNFKKERSVIK